MGPSFETDFSAKEPSLGYYYQIRYSLYLLLHERKKENPCIRLEDLDDIVIAILFLLQKFESLRLISWRNDAIGYLALDQPGRVHIAHIG